MTMMVPWLIWGKRMIFEAWHLVLIAAVVAVAVVVLIRKGRERRQREEIRRAVQPQKPSRQQQLNQLDYLRKRGMVDADEYARSRRAILKSKGR